MAFPATPLDVEVSLALSADLSDPGSWSWTDITAYVRENNRIRIRRGRSSERSTIPPSRCTLVVDNTDGRFCRFLPTGAWYRQIGPNTPIRVRVNNGSGYVTRFVGYVSGWPPSWDPSEQDQTVSLTADGILRRLGQGRVLRSALFRSMSGIAPGDYVPHAYWPMEDASAATRFASGLANGTPGALSGDASLAAASTPAGSDPLPTFDLNTRVTLPIPTYTNTGQWVMQWVVNIPASPAADPQLLAEFRTPGGTVTRWVMTLEDESPSADAIYVRGYNAAGTELISAGTSVDHGDLGDSTDFYGHTFMFTVATYQNGGDVWCWFEGIREDGLNMESALALVAGTHGGLVGNVVLTSPIDGTVMGHPAVFIDPAFNATFGASDADVNAAALDGFAGELAHERVERLCREENLPVTVTATTSQAMGAQRNNTLVALLRECATTDFGLLYEPLDAGLAYLSSSERTNQSAAMTLQYDLGHIAPPWEPTDDDRDTRNDVTASRSGGSSARVTDETSISAIGVYDDTLSINTETDEQLDDVAGWAVNLGTIDELRWPAVKPNLLDHPSLIDDWMAVDLGLQLHVTGHPSPLAPDEIAQIIEGYDETFGSFEYTAVANLSPATGWQVAVYGTDPGGVVSRYDTDGSELGVAVNSSATSLTVATLNMDSPLWTTDGAEVPIALNVAGEKVSATSINSSVRDTFAGSSSSGWGTADSGQVWAVGAGTASLFSETSGVGRIAVTALNTEHYIGINTGYAARQKIRMYQSISVTPTGAGINWGGLLRYDPGTNSAYWIDVQVGTDSSLTLRIISKISGANAQLTTATSATVHSTSVARILVAEISDDDIIRAKVYADGAAEPPWELTWQVSTTDLQTGTYVGAIARRISGNTNVGAINFDTDNFAVLNPQVMTVTRSVNGVVKSQTAGTPVDLWDTPRYAL